MALAFLGPQGGLEDPGDLVDPVVLNESETRVDPVVLSGLGGQRYPVDLVAPLAHEGQDVSAFLGVHVNPEAVAFLGEVLGGLEVLVVP